MDQGRLSFSQGPVFVGVFFFMDMVDPVFWLLFFTSITSGQQWVKDIAVAKNIRCQRNVTQLHVCCSGIWGNDVENLKWEL